jgi:hypothetical protein
MKAGMYYLKSYRRAYLCLLLPAGALLAHVFSFFPDVVEKYYSKGLNRLTIHILSTVTGVFPFSVAELLSVLLVVLIACRLIRAVILLVKEKTVRKDIILGFLINVLMFVSICYFGFILLWGLNYYRLPFADLAQLKVRPASTEELVNVCESVIDRANTLREKVDEGQDGVMRVSGGRSHIFGLASAGYKKAAKKYPELGGIYGKPKSVFLSEAMSYAGISGVYCPFTGEANVNASIPDAILPCSICHEMAHQQGFAREDEADYIAYLTCNLDPDTDYQYSGTLLALIRSMDMLRSYNIDKYNQLQKRYNVGVNRDLANISAYWDKYEGPFTRTTSDINDIYLKSNNQKEGTYSYNRMVDLLIAEYRAKKSMD